MHKKYLNISRQNLCKINLDADICPNAFYDINDFLRANWSLCALRAALKISILGGFTARGSNKNNHQSGTHFVDITKV